jgi:hypothetical protein
VSTPRPADEPKEPNVPADASAPPSAPPPASPPASPSGPTSLDADELEVLRRVRDSLRSIRFGTVLIVVQDGKVVQIETAEKIRLR